MKKIILAGGCFWGVEAYFKRIKGVESSQVGYTDGLTVNPSYQEVCTGLTQHVEACVLMYDETILPLEKILDHLFKIIDPTSLNKQGGDVGTQYRTGIYYSSEEDYRLIQNYIDKQQVVYKNTIVVEVKPETIFYDAETYHQDYLTKNPMGYCHVNLHTIPNDELKECYRR
ncbi:MAG: peptide-methionine (S)-S-oxide reductase MsrA [Turicibacter sp.]